MGNTPAVKLDMSTFQPLDNPAAKTGAYQTKPGGPIQNANGKSVSLDMSTFQPIAGPGEQIGYSGLKDIVPMEGESFEDTMKRAVEYGKTVTKEDLARQSKADLKRAPLALAAGPVMAAGQLAVPVGAGAALAPSVAEESVATGVLDSSGQMIYRTALRYGPNLVQRFGSKAVPWIVTNAVRYAGWSTGSAILHKAMDWLD